MIRFRLSPFWFKNVVSGRNPDFERDAAIAMRQKKIHENVKWTRDMTIETRLGCKDPKICVCTLNRERCIEKSSRDDILVASRAPPRGIQYEPFAIISNRELNFANRTRNIDN